MTTTANITDIESLLVPISDEHPSGEDLQYRGVYDEIRDARREDEDLEQGEWKRDLKVADWPAVVRLSTEALATRTKDLQIGAWLAEALIRLDGFVGCRDGLRLTRELIERFWETLYPEHDDGDLEARANSISWLTRSYADLVKRVPLTSSAVGDALAYFNWEESRRFMIPDSTDGLDSDELRRIGDLREQAADEGKVTSDEWRHAVTRTSRDAYEMDAALLDACWDEFMQLDRVVDEHFGREAPSLAPLRDSLDNVRRLVSTILKEKRALEPRPGDMVEELGDGDSGDGAEQGAPVYGAAHVQVGSIRSRAEALQRLSEVADYFRRNEPHSPVSYLVSRAIKWGKMPLDVWLADVIKNGGVLDELRETLGLTTPPGSDAPDG